MGWKANIWPGLSLIYLIVHSTALWMAITPILEKSGWIPSRILIIDSGGKLSTRLYDKRDDFDFHIVNFPFLSSNIPSGPSYGVYISQLIRYA